MGIMRRRRTRKVLRERSFETRYVRFVVTFLCVVGVIQGLLRFDDMRRLLNESIRLEGEPLSRAVAGLKEPAETWIEWPPVNAGDIAAGRVATICLRFIGRPQGALWVLVNGRAVKRLSVEDGVVSCKDGDLVEILSDKGTINVVVSSTSENVVSPKIGTWVKGKGIVLLGRVRTKTGNEATVEKQVERRR